MPPVKMGRYIMYAPFGLCSFTCYCSWQSLNSSIDRSACLLQSKACEADENSVPSHKCWPSAANACKRLQHDARLQTRLSSSIDRPACFLQSKAREADEKSVPSHRFRPSAANACKRLPHDARLQTGLSSSIDLPACFWQSKASSRAASRPLLQSDARKSGGGGKSKSVRQPGFPK